MRCGRYPCQVHHASCFARRALEVTGEPRPTQSVVDLRQPSGLRAPQSADLAELREIPELIGVAFSDTGEEAMIRPAVLAVAMCVVSSAQSMPYVPLQQRVSWRASWMRQLADWNPKTAEREETGSALVTASPRAAGTTENKYPGAVHAFTNPEATELGKKFNLPLRYDAKVDQEAKAE